VNLYSNQAFVFTQALRILPKWHSPASGSGAEHMSFEALGPS